MDEPNLGGWEDEGPNLENGHEPSQSQRSRRQQLLANQPDKDSTTMLLASPAAAIKGFYPFI